MTTLSSKWPEPCPKNYHPSNNFIYSLGFFIRLWAGGLADPAAGDRGGFYPGLSCRPCALYKPSKKVDRHQLGIEAQAELSFG